MSTKQTFPDRDGLFKSTSGKTHVVVCFVETQRVQIVLNSQLLHKQQNPLRSGGHNISVDDGGHGEGVWDRMVS